jgi:hypothetical protein
MSAIRVIKKMSSNIIIIQQQQAIYLQANSIIIISLVMSIIQKLEGYTPISFMRCFGHTSRLFCIYVIELSHSMTELSHKIIRCIPCYFLNNRNLMAEEDRQVE